VVGVTLIVLGALLVIALAGGAWWLRKTKIVLDEATNCPVDGARAIHVIMFDRSDPISGQQAERIRQVVNGFKSAAVFGERFDIYTFEGDTKAALEPILTLCSPGRPEEANELIQNPERIRQRYEKTFAEVLDRTVDDLLQASTLPNSPIIETIRAAALTSFGPVDGGKVPLRMTLISDMIQHSTLVSHIRSTPDFEALKKNPAWPTLRPELKGAEVDVLYLNRPPLHSGARPIQNRGHQLFWEQLIDAGGGHLEQMEPL
jgi:hypothetical protein